jgi:hypothetical protein
MTVTAGGLSKYLFGFGTWERCRQSKCEATTPDNRADIKLRCVTGNIDTHGTLRQPSVSDNN